MGSDPLVSMDYLEITVGQAYHFPLFLAVYQVVVVLHTNRRQQAITAAPALRRT
jgi:hypothetical protein